MRIAARCILLSGTLLRAPFPGFRLWLPRARADLAVPGINHQAFKIRFTEQYFKRLFSYLSISPANEAPACCSPFSIFRRQVTPRRSCPQYPENGVDNQAIIFYRPAPLAGLPKQMRLWKRLGGIGLSCRRCAFFIRTPSLIWYPLVT